jgi:O-acetylhomoserine/O-acetylserine sulfhydrylase-like pyridoxal-dependent enzyme
VAANRIAALNLDLDPGVLADSAEQGVDLSGLYFPHELAALLEGAGDEILSAADLWKGMPEFEQEDKTAYQSIHVHFKTEQDVEDFARLINQTITDRTRSLWFPFIEIERYADKRYSDES